MGRQLHRTSAAIWGSELSPFSLKLRALCDYAGLDYRWLPAEGTRVENLRAGIRIERGKRARSIACYPRTTDLDEYPLVPYLLLDDGRVLYDSSAIARWLDATVPSESGALFPSEPALELVAHLIDEALDEFGLYMVHHNRWVVAARGNDAGARLGHEFRNVVPPGFGGVLARRFARRQVRRLPYLFSVAPTGYVAAGLALELRPPSRKGFPATHALLDGAYLAYVDALEEILAARPYLLGERFTVADASVYGCLAINLDDPEAAALLEKRGPLCYRWLRAIRERKHVGSIGRVGLHPVLSELLEIVETTFVPLMRQNEAAYRRAVEAGESLFAEKAFDEGRALYDGELLGMPFRSVVKPFQVRVWRELREAWKALSTDAQAEVAAVAGERVRSWFA